MKGGYVFSGRSASHRAPGTQRRLCHRIVWRSGKKDVSTKKVRESDELSHSSDAKWGEKLPIKKGRPMF